MAIESRLHILLAERRMSVADFAREAGFHYATAHALVEGENKGISFEVLDKTCAALGVQPGDVFVYVENGQE